jgi:hypothetical protein
VSDAFNPILSEADVWKIIARHYTGSIDPPSLLAQKLYAVAIDIRMATETACDEFWVKELDQHSRTLWDLENQVRALRGEPPLPPIPMASGRSTNALDAERIDLNAALDLNEVTIARQAQHIAALERDLRHANRNLQAITEGTAWLIEKKEGSR